MRRPASRLVLLACGRHSEVHTPRKLPSYSAVALPSAAAASLARICASMPYAVKPVTSASASSDASDGASCGRRTGHVSATKQAPERCIARWGTCHHGVALQQRAAQRLRVGRRRRVGGGQRRLREAAGAGAQSSEPAEHGKLTGSKKAACMRRNAAARPAARGSTPSLPRRAAAAPRSRPMRCHVGGRKQAHRTPCGAEPPCAAVRGIRGRAAARGAP